MPTIEEYKKKGGWYEFPNGEKRQGEEAAQEYLDSVDAEELFEESVEETEDVPAEGTITSDSLDSSETVEEPEAETPEEKVVTTSDSDSSQSSDDMLVRRRRPGVKYAVKGPSGKRYTFTREHPLVVVRKEDVEFFVSQEDFELATPAQAQEFYS